MKLELLVYRTANSIVQPVVSLATCIFVTVDTLFMTMYRFTVADNIFLCRKCSTSCQNSANCDLAIWWTRERNRTIPILTPIGSATTTWLTSATQPFQYSATNGSKISGSTAVKPWRYRQYVSPKRWHLRRVYTEPKPRRIASSTSSPQWKSEISHYSSSFIFSLCAQYLPSQ
jgi:hypothetical protein